MELCIAGKNNLAVDCLIYSINVLNIKKICVVVNENDLLKPSMSAYFGVRLTFALSKTYVMSTRPTTIIPAIIKNIAMIMAQIMLIIIKTPGILPLKHLSNRYLCHSKIRDCCHFVQDNATGRQAR